MAENLQTNETPEVNTNNNEGANETNKNIDNFAEKFEEILDGKFDKVAKSILKANGIEEDSEVKELIASYHARKQETSKKTEDELAALKRENEALKAEKFNAELESSIKNLASELKFDDKYIKQIMKLADLNDIKTKDGHVDITKVSTAISKVLEECEAFKIKEEKESGFKKIGAGKNDPEIETGKNNLTLAQLMKQHSKKH